MRRDRVRIASFTLEGVGEGGHKAKSVGCRWRSFMVCGFWLRDGVFGKEAREHYTPSHRRTPKARNAHLVRFGHVNTTAKLAVEEGSEHGRGGRGDGDAGRLSCARDTPAGHV